MELVWDLDPEVLHLNHGSFGAVPRPVREAQEDWHRRIEASPDRFFLRELRRHLDEAREAAAAFLGADPGGLAFVENATAGINTVLAAVGLGPGDEVLMTDHAYGACRIAAARACRRGGARLVVQPVPLELDAADVVEAVCAAASPRTRLAIVDHIASPTAFVFPVREIAARLRERGVAVAVDAAHVPGMLEVRLRDEPFDFWVGNFHKWAGAPRGAAALYVAEGRRAAVEPLVASWRLEEGYPASFSWTGTRDWTPHLCLPVALGLGWERVRERNAALARYGREVVSRALGTPPPGPEGGIAMSLVALPEGVGATAEEAEALRDLIYAELRAETAPVAWGGRGYLRLSAQAYNRPQDYEQLAAGLARLGGIEGRS